MLCGSCGKVMKKVKKDYSYVESGLDNIVLSDLTVVICECGEEMPIIPHIEELHRVIAFELVKDKNHLSGKEARFIRKQLGMKSTELADILGVDKVTISRWENDNKPIGAANDRLIRSLYLAKLAEELKQFVPIAKLFSILSSIVASQSTRRKPINVPINKISKYNYDFARC